MNSKIDDYRIIATNNLHEMQTYVDSYHTVHKYMREYTGGVSNFGREVLMATSSKQKMNLISSNESEEIGNR